MKNLLKFGFLGLALTFMITACNQPTETQEAEEVEVITDADTTIVTDVDTSVADTTVIDTAAEQN